MSEDVLRNLLEDEEIDNFIHDNKIKLKDTYLYLLEAYRKIHGNPRTSSSIHSAFWEILRLAPIMSGIFFALGGEYVQFHDKSYFQNPVAQKIISMVLEMLRTELPDEI